MIPIHVAVRAPEGRSTPLHQNDGLGPNGAQTRVNASDPRPTKARWSTETRRNINRGDLYLCSMSGEPVASAELAAWDDAWAPPQEAAASPQAADYPAASSEPATSPETPMALRSASERKGAK